MRLVHREALDRGNVLHDELVNDLCVIAPYHDLAVLGARQDVLAGGSDTRDRLLVFTRKVTARLLSFEVEKFDDLFFATEG